MTGKKNAILFRIAAVCLIVVFIFPCPALAAPNENISTYASDYLDSYNAYICAMGSGKLEIWFSVTGTYYMEDIGTLKIMLYESTDLTNWTWVETFLHEDYDTMLAQNDYFYASHVDYQGVAGRYYKAYVCIWAGKDDGGDTRYMWTSVEKAT